MKTLYIFMIFAVAALVPSAVLADPGTPFEPETCRFLPVENRYLLPPDHPCHLDPPQICYTEGGVPIICE